MKGEQYFFWRWLGVVLLQVTVFSPYNYVVDKLIQKEKEKKKHD